MLNRRFKISVKTSDAKPSPSNPAPVTNEAKPNVKPAGKQSTKPAVMTKDSPVKGGSNPVGISL